jgi:hypothetical protein
MTDYRFVTTWRIDASIDRVWEALIHPERWPDWWPGVLAVQELSAGDAAGIGDRRRYTWKSKLPYKLVFDVTTTRIERPHHLEGIATGELEGMGRWLLSERNSEGGAATEAATEVRYTWEVRTTRPWMNLLAPIARPIFARNHDIIMRWGGDGLGRLLGARVEHLGDGEVTAAVRS